MSVKSDNTENIEEIYEDQDVLRYDADPYRKKYGDKWKKYATAIRDVPQEDGSVIREYVIEDPSLLDELSEQEDDLSSLRSIQNNKPKVNNNNNKTPTPTNNSNSPISQKQSLTPSPTPSPPLPPPPPLHTMQPVTKIVKSETPKSLEKIKNESISPSNVSQIPGNLRNRNGSSSSPLLKNLPTNKINNLLPSIVGTKATKHISKVSSENTTTPEINNETSNKSQNRTQENSTILNRQTSNETFKPQTIKKPNVTSPINSQRIPNQNVTSPTNSQRIPTQNFTSPNNSQRLTNTSQNIRKPSLNEDDADKEIEIIQDSFKKSQSNENLSQMNNNNSTETIVEYEIMDEHGNLIKLDGAEQLKQLATCVKHVQESDGSVVKEYILNDPKIIEQIKTQIKERENAAIHSRPNQDNSPSQITKVIPTSSSSSTSSASMSSQQQQFPQQPQQSSHVFQKFNENFKPRPQQQYVVPSNNEATATSTTQPSQAQVASNNKPIFKLPTHLQMVRLNKLNNVPTNEQINQNIENLNYNTNQKLSHSYRSPQEQNQPIPNLKQQFYNEMLNQKQKSLSNKETELRQIDFNKYEILTTSGKTIQFTITSGNASSSDVKEIKSAIENQILNEPRINFNDNKTLPQLKPSQVNHMKTKVANKSCENLTSVENSESAFINYKNTNNNSQVSLAKLKNSALTSSYGNINDTNEVKYENPQPRSNSAFKRSISLGHLNELSNHNDDNDTNSNTAKNTRNPTNDPVTPEMTEQLILQLLLKQLVANQTINNTNTIKPTNVMPQVPPPSHPQVSATNNNYQPTNKIYDQLLDLKDVKLQPAPLLQNPYYQTNITDLSQPQFLQRPYYTINNQNYPLLFNRPLNNPNVLDPYYRYNNLYRKN